MTGYAAMFFLLFEGVVFISSSISSILGGFSYILGRRLSATS